MKENELRRHAVCSKCGHKIGHTGLPLFWVVTAVRYGLDRGALQRQAGLTAMLGGSVELARVMGPDEDMAQGISRSVLTLCEECALPLMSLLESHNAVDDDLDSEAESDTLRKEANNG